MVHQDRVLARDENDTVFIMKIGKCQPLYDLLLKFKQVAGLSLACVTRRWSCQFKFDIFVYRILYIHT